MRSRLGPCRVRGFTLLELLVVVVIIGVMVGLAGVQLMRGPGEAVRDESERLALLLQAARDEAILQGIDPRWLLGSAGSCACPEDRDNADGRLEQHQFHN